MQSIHHSSVALFFFLTFLLGAAENGNKPKAYIYVGPHKTASTYLELGLMYTYRSDLVDRNFYQFNPDAGPWIVPGGVVDVQFGYQRCEGNSQAHLSAMQQFQSFVSACRQNNSNIVMAGEELSRLKSPCIEKFAGVFTGFDVQIVIHYRDFLNLQRSWHMENNKQSGDSFYSFASSSLHNFITDPLDIRFLVDRFGSAFGFDNIHVTDYNGAIAANADFLKIFVNDIMGLDIVINPPPPANVSPENLDKQSFRLVLHNYLLIKHNCGIFTGNYDPYYANKYSDHPPFRKVTLNVSLYHEFSNLIDLEFREKYGTRVHVYYANRTAFLKTTVKTAEEVDILHAMRDPDWIAYLNNIITRERLLEKCSNSREGSLVKRVRRGRLKRFTMKWHNVTRVKRGKNVDLNPDWFKKAGP